MAAQLYPLLFSEHFLRHRLAQRYHQDLESLRPRAQSSWDALLKRWDKERHVLAQLSESDLEKRWVYPLLDDLWPDSLLSQAQQSGDRPDFTFYKSPQDRDAAGQPGADPFAQAVALGEVESWDTDLDKVKGKESPHGQIRRYIGNLLPQWGLLTNGRLWRLYAQNVRTADKSFVTFDLVEMIKQQEFETFLRFFFLFEQQAILSKRLDLIQEESNRFVVGVGEALRRQVFAALEAIVNGWAGLDPALAQDEAGRKRLYDSGVIYLYRLLFLLYAESRDLLPLENAVYRREYSLAHLLDMLEEDQPLDTAYPAGTLLADELADLFAHLNRGRPEAGIAAYNGGLFRPTGIPGLEAPLVDDANRRLPNSALGAVLRALAYADGERVDYYDLRVQQLGTIYEGLLEHHLEWANGRLVPVYDRGERKVLGGFYTPDEVVAYIVQQTLEPLVRQSSGKYRSVEEIMGLRVLDPAMGSGHFLVGALEYLAEAAARAALQAHNIADTVVPDTTWYKRAIAERCLYGVDLNPLAVELAKLSLWLATADRGKPLSFLDHHFKCGNSLVGAWVRDLGHPPRLKGKQQQQVLAGQMSLFETHLDALLPTMMGEVIKILEQPSDNLAQVQEKAAANQAVEDLRAPFLAVAHAWTAASFGLDVAASYDHLLNLLPKPDALLAEPLAQEAGALARQHTFFHWELAFPDAFYQVVQGGAQRRPDAGFHAVVGNPPYVRQELLGPYKPFFQGQYETYQGTADLYVYFFERALNLLAANGRLGYIGSNSWLRTRYATPLRRYLRTRVTVERLVDLGDNRVFADAPDVYTAIALLRRAVPPADHDAQVAVFARGEVIDLSPAALAPRWITVDIHDQPDAGWRLEKGTSRSLGQKILAAGKPLAEVVGGQIYRGVLTGLNEAFIVDQATRDRLAQQDPTCAALLKPLVNGEDVRPWYVEDEGRYLIAIPDGWTRSTAQQAFADEAAAWQWFGQRHPALVQHLTPFADRARARTDQGEYWWELRPCAYWGLFEQPKILWPEMSKYPRFALADAGVVGNKTTFMIPAADYYLLGILMSRPAWFAVQTICQPIGERGGLLRYMLSEQFMEHLPIPDAPDAERQVVAALAQKLTDLSRQRYQVRRATGHRIQVDLLPQGVRLNQKLGRWWELDFTAFRTEVKKCGGQDIPVPERAQWEHYLQTQAQEYLRLRGDIVTAAEALDQQVYDLYGLGPAEIDLVKKATGYGYGEI